MLGLVALSALGLAFWVLDHSQAFPNAIIISAASAGIFFFCALTAFMLLSGQHNRNRPTNRNTVQSEVQDRKELEGTVYGLIPGRQYRVIKPFIDYRGNTFERDELLRFKERHFLPYDDGHTVIFEERNLFLQEQTNQTILENFSEYITPFGH